MARTIRTLLLVTIALLVVAVSASSFDAVTPNARTATKASTNSDDTLSTTVIDFLVEDVDVKIAHGPL